MIKTGRITFRFWSLLSAEMYDVVDAIFAAKPLVDAISTVLFLGEYRKNAAAVLKHLRWCFEEILPATQATVAHVGAANPNGNPASTVSPMPSSFSSSHFTAHA